MHFVVASLLFLAVSAHAKILTLQSPRFVVIDSTGQQTRTQPLSLVNKSPSPIQLNTTDTLKITFQVVDKENGQGLQPHQTFLRFYDTKTNEEGIQPIRVTPGGKAKFELNMSRPPNSFPPTTIDSPLQVSLYIAKPDYSPISTDIFDLYVPASQPISKHPEADSFELLPEIQHTFRPDQTLPPKFISAVFSGLVIAPWAILLGLWSKVSPRITHAFSLSIFPFILSLGAFEGLVFYYWVDLKLGQVLTYGFILSLVSLFTGRQALRSVATRRINKN